jgi:hypothetical protein
MRDKAKCVGETKLFVGYLDLSKKEYATSGSACLYLFIPK